MNKRQLATLLHEKGQRYTETLGINIDAGDDKQIFKWFLAAILYGAPITETTATKTYKTFKKHNLLTPQKIAETGWDGLVKILDEGKYTRYDYKTATKLLTVTTNLNKNYHGSLTTLHQEALDSADLEKKLRELGKGIGNITVSIFLRELRDTWNKADPKPTPTVIQAAKNLRITKTQDPTQALTQMKDYWKHNKVKGMSFINLETALLRWSKQQRRTKKPD